MGWPLAFPYVVTKGKDLQRMGRRSTFKYRDVKKVVTVQDVPLDTKEELIRDFWIPSFSKVRDPTKPGLDDNDGHWHCARSPVFEMHENVHDKLTWLQSSRISFW